MVLTKMTKIYFSSIEDKFKLDANIRDQKYTLLAYTCRLFLLASLVSIKFKKLFHN